MLHSLERVAVRVSVKDNNKTAPLHYTRSLNASIKRVQGATIGPEVGDRAFTITSQGIPDDMNTLNGKLKLIDLK